MDHATVSGAPTTNPGTVAVTANDVTQLTATNRAGSHPILHPTANTAAEPNLPCSEPNALLQCAKPKPILQRSESKSIELLKPIPVRAVPKLGPLHLALGPTTISRNTKSLV